MSNKKRKPSKLKEIQTEQQSYALRNGVRVSMQEYSRYRRDLLRKERRKEEEKLAAAAKAQAEAEAEIKAEILAAEEARAAEEAAKPIPNDQYDWPAIARPNQRLPLGDWHIWLILAGRGFGKTRTGAETLRQWIMEGKCRSVALLAENELDARQVMVEGVSGILAVHPEHERPEFLPSIRELHWPNGAKGRIFSAEAYERLRGPQFDGAWVDELAKFRRVQDVWDQLMFSMRVGKHPQVVVTTTPKPLNFLRGMVESEYTVTTRGSSYENLENLSPNFVQLVLDRYKHLGIGAQEIYAEILQHNPTLLFQKHDINYLG